MSASDIPLSTSSSRELGSELRLTPTPRSTLPAATLGFDRPLEAHAADAAAIATASRRTVKWRIPSSKPKVFQTRNEAGKRQADCQRKHASNRQGRIAFRSLYIETCSHPPTISMQSLSALTAQHVDDHDDHGGLHRDLRETDAAIDRRRMLRLAARFGVALGGLQLIGCGGEASALTGTDTSNGGTSNSGSSACPTKVP